jgi:hypothetical protein
MAIWCVSERCARSLIDVQSEHTLPSVPDEVPQPAPAVAPAPVAAASPPATVAHTSVQSTTTTMTTTTTTKPNLSATRRGEAHDDAVAVSSDTSAKSTSTHDVSDALLERVRANVRTFAVFARNDCRSQRADTSARLSAADLEELITLVRVVVPMRA